MTAAAPALTTAIGDFRDELLPGAAGGVFVAIDFETADEQRDSACSIALVRVEGDTIVASKASLIRPPRPSSLLTHIHGISEAAQRAAPKLRDIWPDMAPLLEGAELLVAHNATFDRAVMAASWGIRGMDLPGLPWACTVKMARRLWPKGAGLPDHKLPSLVRFLGLPTLNHHNALSDAEACARLVLAARRGAAGQPRPALPVPAPAPAAPAPAPPPLEPALVEVLALVELGRSAYRQTDSVPDIDTLQRSFVDPWARTVVGLAWLAEHLEADLEAAARRHEVRVESRMRSLVSLLSRPWHAPPDFVELVHARQVASAEMRREWHLSSKEERQARKDLIRDFDDQIEAALSALRGGAS